MHIGVLLSLSYPYSPSREEWEEKVGHSPCLVSVKVVACGLKPWSPDDQSSPAPATPPFPLGPHLEIVVLRTQLFQLPHQASGPTVQHLLGEVGEG